MGRYGDHEIVILDGKPNLQDTLPYTLNACYLIEPGNWIVMYPNRDLYVYSEEDLLDKFNPSHGLSHVVNYN